MLALGVKGGQFSDGSQKDGILKYEKGKIVGVYEPHAKEYRMVADFQAKVEAFLGTMPAAQPWKNVVNNPAKEDILKKYFREIKTASGKGAEMTRNYALKSNEIGTDLVKNKVAFSEKDVNTVLLTGFFHAYGPVNDYLM
jgi:hypothetical protein